MKDEVHPGKRCVLIVEDHVVVREGFAALVNREADLRACGQTASAREALELVESCRPDIVIIDLVLREGDGLELIKDLHALYPDIPVLVVSMQDENVYAERSLRAGAKGYVMKYSATEDFLEGIRSVLAGQYFVSPKINARILSSLASGAPPDKPGDYPQLSDRELQVFQMLGSGLRTRDIAKRLGISPKTVDTYRENIKQKLGIHDSAALVHQATSWVNENL